MKTNSVSIIITCFVILTTLSISDARGQLSKNELMHQAESRLRSIYEQGSFRPKSFRADWLHNSSGYTVIEQHDESNKRVTVSYDAATGKRKVRK